MAIHRVSTTSDGKQGDGDSDLAQDNGAFGYLDPNSTSLPSVFSPDGKQIVFTTSAPDIAGSANTEAVVVKDLSTGQVKVETTGLSSASDAIFSPDGSAIVYHGTIAGSDSGDQLYELNTKTGQSKLISGDAAGNAGDGDSDLVAMSADGKRVIFRSSSTNLTGSGSGSGNGFREATFVKALDTGKIFQIASEDEFVTATSRDFGEALTISIPQGPGQVEHIYAENLTTGARVEVDASAAGAAGNRSAYGQFLGSSSSRVVFESEASNISASASSGGIFIKDISTQAVSVVATNRLTISSPNAQGTVTTTGIGNALSGVSADGTKIVYLVSNGTSKSGPTGFSDSGTEQLQIKTIATGSVQNASTVVTGSSSYKNSANGFSSSANGTSINTVRFSPDGTKVAYVTTTANNFMSSYDEDTSSTTTSGSISSNLNVFNAATGATNVVPISSGGLGSGVPFLTFSPDGTKVVYVALTSSPGNNGESSQIGVYDVASHALTTYTGQEGYGRLAFSADGSKFAYSGYNPESNSGSTEVIDLKTGAHVTVPTESVFFSPDGKTFAYSSGDPLVAGDTNDADDVFTQSLCFAGGTMIRAWRDGAETEVAVEKLVVGDLAVTASAARRPIKWIGHRTIDGGARAMSSDAWPVCIRAGAFGTGPLGDTVPSRDLRLSPGHPVLVGSGADEVLVPIMCLINGTTVRRVAVDTVTYWHVELDAHDILLAEGLPAESYIDLGSRPWFDGADGVLYDPDLALPGMPGRCRPVATEGPKVDAERRRLDGVFAMRLAAACAWPTETPVFV